MYGEFGDEGGVSGGCSHGGSVGSGGDCRQDNNYYNQLWNLSGGGDDYCKARSFDCCSISILKCILGGAVCDASGGGGGVVVVGVVVVQYWWWWCHSRFCGGSDSLYRSVSFNIFRIALLKGRLCDGGGCGGVGGG